MRVHTRENRKDVWWCNTTIQGTDVSVEGASIEEARAKMVSELKRVYNVDTSQITWTPIQNYIKYEPLQAAAKTIVTRKASLYTDVISITHNSASNQSVTMYISVRVSDALGITIGDRIAFSENPFRLYRPGNLSSVKSCKIGATRCISLHVLTPRDEMLGKWSYEIENETVYLLERSI